MTAKPQPSKPALRYCKDEKKGPEEIGQLANLKSKDFMLAEAKAAELHSSWHYPSNQTTCLKCSEIEWKWMKLDEVWRSMTKLDWTGSRALLIQDQKMIQNESHWISTMQIQNQNHQKNNQKQSNTNLNQAQACANNLLSTSFYIFRPGLMPPTDHYSHG